MCTFFVVTEGWELVTKLQFSHYDPCSRLTLLLSLSLSLCLSAGLQIEFSGREREEKNRATVFCSSDPTGEKGFLDKFISCGARSV